MSEFIAEAQVLVVPNTAAFAAALKAQVEAAVAAVGPVTIPVAAVPVSTGAGAAVAAETQAATAATAAQTGALKTQKAASAEAAAAARKLAKEEAIAARVHAQAARGIAAETLALTGLRGATLAASAPFLIGATAAIVFSKAIKEASDQVEEINKVIEVFGERSGKEIEDFAKTTAASLGISEVEALRAAGVFGNLFRSLKISEPVAAAMSERLVRLAADLASFNNASPERTLEALRAGLVGQARPLRVFGAFLTAARVKQEALIETGKKQVSEITEANKVQARYNLILQDTRLAQGDVARTQDRFANQSRILKAQLSDLGAELGRVLVPAALFAVQGLNDLVDEINTMNDKIEAAEGHIKDFAQFVSRLSPVELVIKVIEEFPGGSDAEGFFKKFKADLEIGLGAAAITAGAATSELGVGLPVAAAGTVLLAKGLHDLNPETKDAADKMSGLSDALDAGARAARLAAFAIVSASRSVKDLDSTLAGLEITRLKIQTGLAPGGRQAEEANLRQQIEDDKKAVALAASGTKARRDALEKLKQDQDDLASLEDQDAQDAKDRANRIKEAAQKRKQAAREVAQAQQDDTQAFIESFGPKAQRLQNRLTTAQLFQTPKSEIAVNKLIIAADKAEIDAIQDRIRHLKLHGEALKIAQAEIARLNQEIFDTQNAIAQLQASRKQAIADARQSHLEAQLAIAETTKSTKDDIAAEKALIKFDQAQIRRILAIKRRRRLTLEEAAQLDAYRVDLAQRNQALRELKKEQDKGNQTAKEFFSFLQTQAGFAANLLGNLIPGSATAGLVGGTANAAAAAAFGQPGGPQPGGGVIPGMAVTASAAAAASRDRGVRPVQVDTTNQILRHILRVLQHQTGRMGHPEARYQKASGGAALDTL